MGGFSGQTALSNNFREPALLILRLLFLSNMAFSSGMMLTFCAFIRRAFVYVFDLSITWERRGLFACDF